MSDEIGPDTPLRLARAAALAFPGGGMTDKGLRREHARGNLTVERIANKDYTTLAYIEEMRRLCRLDAGRTQASPQSETEMKLDAFLTSLKVRTERVTTQRRQKKP